MRRAPVKGGPASLRRCVIRSSCDRISLFTTLLPPYWSVSAYCTRRATVNFHTGFGCG